MRARSLNSSPSTSMTGALVVPRVGPCGWVWRVTTGSARRAGAEGAEGVEGLSEREWAEGASEREGVEGAAGMTGSFAS